MRKLALSVVSILVFYIINAQKIPLDHTVYDSWQHIGERIISPDGKWIVYTVEPQQGDNELVIVSADTQYRKIIERGYSAVITEDSRFLIFKIKPHFKDTREARIRKKKPEDMPKDSLAIVRLGQEEIFRIARVKSFKTPQKSSGWVAYHLEKKPVQPAKQKPAENNDKRVADSLYRLVDSLRNEILSASKTKKKKRNKDDVEEDNMGEGSLSAAELYLNAKDAEGDDPAITTADSGTDLVLRNLESGEEIVFTNSLEYIFSNTGNRLLVEKAKDPKDSLGKSSVVLYDAPGAKLATLSKGGNEFKNFAISENGDQVAYLGERNAKPKELQKFYRIWYFSNGMDSAMLLADKGSVGMDLGMTVSEFSNLGFSKSGQRLFFGVSPIQPPRDTTLVDFEHAKLDIWHYNDDYLQTAQNFPARLKAAREENFLAVIDLTNRQITRLGSKELPQVIQTDEGDGKMFIGVTDTGRRVESQWLGTTRKDIYAIDAQTGERKLVKSNLSGSVYPSPSGKCIIWYDRKEKHYFSWDGKVSRNISAAIRAPLWNEESDIPDEPGNYGVMGWHEGDSALYVYDRFNIWKIDLVTRKLPSRISDLKAQKRSVRYVRVDEDERFFTAGQEMYFRLFDETTKQGAIASGHLQNDIMFNEISEGPFSFNFLRKAKNAGMLIYSKENFRMPPDIYVNAGNQLTGGHEAGLNVISNEVKLSALNPQQDKYLWGSAELFHWKAPNGKAATGIVYKPENFDPAKKYPVIIYFYEKLSQTLYTYKEPAPIRSAVNIPFFVSRGYVIFIPDIEYTVGKPGQSAYDYIVSGANALIKTGWVDSKNIALQGHSWGGYQAAQVATMTNMFKAIWAGAPVANMTSAYGGIRWESGNSRQFQYERTQSRIGGTLWEKLPLYLENSPLFHLDKVKAPMVIMHNDADGAVPWYQGIELFTALRRLDKKVWLLNYNGQGHGLTQRQDMFDYQVRMQQFFDWILKGEPPARWISDGVPAVKKGRDWGLQE